MGAWTHVIGSLPARLGKGALRTGRDLHHTTQANEPGVSMNLRGDRDDLNEMLDPHRRDEIAGAAVEVSGRLFQKGVEVSADEDPAELADLLSAVERFENAVINRGGDTMINMPNSTDPQDPAFVLPARRADESIADYTRHIIEAATMLEEPRRI